MATNIEQLRMVVGNRIRELRRAKGLSQAAVADRAGLPVDTWSRLERGAALNPTLSSYLSIADALDAQLGDFFPVSEREVLSPYLEEMVAVLRNVGRETQESLLGTVKALLREHLQ